VVEFFQQSLLYDPFRVLELTQDDIQVSFSQLWGNDKFHDSPVSYETQDTSRRYSQTCGREEASQPTVFGGLLESWDIEIVQDVIKVRRVCFLQTKAS
jgi:hypothetical protein